MPPKFTPADVTSLCDAAKDAWGKISPNARRAEFTWRGKKYVATHTSFRLLVHTLDGTPVAARYD